MHSILNLLALPTTKISRNITEIKKVLLCVCLKFELLCEMFAQWEDEKIREIEIADKRLERLYIYERDKGIYIYESDYGLIHFKSSSLIQSY